MKPTIHHPMHADRSDLCAGDGYGFARGDGRCIGDGMGTGYGSGDGRGIGDGSGTGFGNSCGAGDGNGDYECLRDCGAYEDES
jgi:hypothetical protein